jgi:hypothetical protein
MPKSVWEKAGDEARAKLEQVAESTDGVGDSVLSKLKASKFTGVIVIGVIALLVLAVVL